MIRRTFLLVLAGFFSNVGSAEPAVVGALELQIERVLPTGQATVSVQNLEKKPLRMWRNGNEWGSARWSIAHISNGRLQTYYQDPDRIFSPNAPNFDEVPAGKSVRITLDLNGWHWLQSNSAGFGVQSAFGGLNSISARLEVRFSNRARA